MSQNFNKEKEKKEKAGENPKYERKAKDICKSASKAVMYLNFTVLFLSSLVLKSNSTAVTEQFL